MANGGRSKHSCEANNIFDHNLHEPRPMSRRNSNSQSSSRTKLDRVPSPGQAVSLGSSSRAVTTTPGELLLIIFIHGFKGDDATFQEFPDRLQHLLTQTVQNLMVECIVFPAYETKGDLDKAVVRFADWLATLTVEREVASGGGAGKAKIVLCGHSMGGLLAADSLREFVGSRPDPGSPLWPRIIACLAFDTPYLGLHPSLVKNGVTKAADHVSAATTLGSALFGSLAGLSAGKAATASSSTSPAPPNAASSQKPATGWARWAAPAAYAIGGAIIAGAAAGGAYYAKDHLTQSYSWMMDHMKYVGNLWDEGSLQQRIDALVDIEEKHGVTFRNFYTQIPPSPPSFLESRTFSVLPKYGTRGVDHFVPARNTLAEDEIHAHTGMFAPSTNDGYYDLGLSAAKVIREAYYRITAEQASMAAIASKPRGTPRRSSVSSTRAKSPAQPPSRPASRSSPRPKSPPAQPTQTTPVRRSTRLKGKPAEEDLISF